MKKTKQSQPKIGSNWVDVENSMPQKIVLERLITGGKSFQSTYTVKLKVWDEVNKMEYKRHGGILDRDDLVREIVKAYIPYHGEEKYIIKESK